MKKHAYSSQINLRGEGKTLVYAAADSWRAISAHANRDEAIL